MARLLIVSRSMALAMRLADEHDVTEHSADELDALDPATDADVLILDIGDPVRSVDTVNGLREAGSTVPVLLVSGYQPEWEQVESQRVAGVAVVPLPITRGALLNGVRALLDAERLSPESLGLERDAGPDDESADETMPVATRQPDDTAAMPTVAVKPADAEPLPEPLAERMGDGEPPADEPTEDAAEPGDAGPPEDAAEPGDADPPEDAAEPGDTEPPEDAAEPGDAEPPGDGDEFAGEPADEVPGESAEQPRNGHQPRTRTPARPRSGLPPGLQHYDVGREHERTGASAPELQDEPENPPWMQVEAPAARPPGSGGSWWSRDSRSESEANTGDGPDPADPQTAPAGISTGSGGISIGGLRARIGERQRKRRGTPSVTSTPAPGVGLITDPIGPRTDPRGVTTALDRRLDAEAGALLGNAVVRDVNGVALRMQDLIQVLNEHAANLYGVGDTAQVLADDAIEKADADAAAVLVPDGPSWRVSGGVGLRPLERRLVLADEHWLVAEIALGGRAVLVEDTDVIRQQLSGAPLAAWRHLLAVPIPDVQGIVVLARGQEGGAFTDHELSTVIGPVREAAPLLGQAIEIRRLARLLGPLREMEWENSRRAD